MARVFCFRYICVFEIMVHLKTREEIELMRESAQVVSRTLGLMAEHIKPGVTPLELDKIAEEYIRDQGAEPGFLGLYDYPNTIITSVNEQVVHGLPTNRPLENGDVVGLDCGALKNGFYGDHAYTFAVGEIEEDIKKLLLRTEQSLYLGIEQAKAGNRIGDIGYAIQNYTESFGYGVVRELVGHGLGRKMHESPEVPNYGKRGHGTKIKEGMVIAIEPMINMGTRRVIQLSDGWTIVTADKKPSAHFEHDVAIVDGKPEILSTFKYVEEVLKRKNGLLV
ncbi:MAG: methionyl aminopeptidase [Cyclobacteriaceae bacterium]|jgi:methionyl aminopeptidase